MTAHTRADLLLMALTADAIAGECRRRLKDEIHNVFETQRTADTWKIPGVGTVAASQNQDRVEVVDQAAVTQWVAANYPTEVETVTRIRNTSWLTAVLEELVPVPPVDVPDNWNPSPGDMLAARDQEGRLVPGVKWRVGGDFRSASIIPDKPLTKRLVGQARDFVDAGGSLPALTSTVVWGPEPDGDR